MPAYKNVNGTWYVSFYYRDLNGKNVKKKENRFCHQEGGSKMGAKVYRN